MTILSHKLGPGTLTIGAGPLDASAQVSAIRVTPRENVSSSDALPVLSGEELPGEDIASLEWELTATVVQDDLSAPAFIAYTWDNAGTEQPFTFIPSTAAARQITGTVRIVPIAIGGDIKRRNTSDITWRITDTPVLAAVI